MPVGIEKLNLYSSSLMLDLANLAERRKRDLQDLQENLFLNHRSVNPPWEDTVTMAVNAAKPMLTEQDKQDIELLIVGTESAVDFGKPAATWAHKFLGINPNCRTYETKHACYSGMAGYTAALGWLEGNAPPGKKALVIAADYSRSHFGAHHEFVLGGIGAAMLCSRTPKIVEVETDKVGYWTTEIADTFRPTSIVEMGNNETSLYSYLDALEGSLTHFLSKVPECTSLDYFKKHLYHMPFGGMTFQAHRNVCGRFGIKKKSEIRASWEAKVRASLRFAREVGSCYGGSTFAALAGMVLGSDDIQPGDRASVFVYGSGCQGEFYSQKFLADAKATVQSMKIDEQMADRHEISVDEYEAVEKLRESYVDKANVTPDTSGFDGWYDRHYKGKGYLVLKQVDNYYRTYDWS
ncbi:MAG: hydroxymethylglutaryl-CoA synthase family protein [Planctomycetota bacterium]